jgi:hypothetical protein
MDLLDLWWNSNQELQLRDVRQQIERLKLERDLRRMNAPDLAAENHELRLRLGLLVRLLIAKGILTAEEYARLIAEAQPTTRSDGV